jgi:uncharacterized protein (TIGR00369 family)
VKNLSFDLKIPFIELLGAQPVHLEKGRAVVSLDMRPELTNSWEAAHGAVVVALLDVSMAMAARSSNDHANGVVTVDLSVNFTRAGTGRLTAEGRVLRNGRSLVFCEGELHDDSGALIAKAIGTFKLRSREDEAPAKSRRKKR